MIANIAFWVVFIGVVVFTLGFGSSLYIAREEISKEMDQKIDSDISYVLSYVDGQLQRVEDVAYTLLSSKFAKIIRTIDGKNVVTIDPKDFLPISEEEVFQLLEHFLDANPFIFLSKFNKPFFNVLLINSGKISLKSANLVPGL